VVLVKVEYAAGIISSNRNSQFGALVLQVSLHGIQLSERSPAQMLWYSRLSWGGRRRPVLRETVLQQSVVESPYLSVS